MQPVCFLTFTNVHILVQSYNINPHRKNIYHFKVVLRALIATNISLFKFDNI